MYGAMIFMMMTVGLINAAQTNQNNQNNVPTQNVPNQPVAPPTLPFTDNKPVTPPSPGNQATIAPATPPPPPAEQQRPVAIGVPPAAVSSPLLRQGFEGQAAPTTAPTSPAPAATVMPPVPAAPTAPAVPVSSTPTTPNVPPAGTPTPVVVVPTAMPVAAPILPAASSTILPVTAPVIPSAQPTALPVSAPVTQPMPQMPLLRQGSEGQARPVTPQMPSSQAAPVPAAVQAPQQRPSVAISEQDLKTLDTINLQEPSGNWLYKRIWYEKAEEVTNRIKEIVTQIVGARTTFNMQRNEIEEKIFEPLYVDIGMGQGELSVILSYLIGQMQALREKQGVLAKEEREFLDNLESHQKTLEQLNEDIQTINKLDDALDESLEKLMDQIAIAREFEKKAWDYFRSIAKELSDVKARELYYQTEALEQSAQDTLRWIQQDFSKHFAQIVTIAREQADRIKSNIRALKEKGIDFKKQAETIERQAQEREKAAAEQKAQEKTEQKPAAQSSWLAPLYSAWRYVSDAVGSVYDTVVGWFSSKSEEPTPVSAPANPERAPVVPTPFYKNGGPGHPDASTSSAVNALPLQVEAARPEPNRRVEGRQGSEGQAATPSTMPVPTESNTPPSTATNGEGMKVSYRQQPLALAMDDEGVKLDEPFDEQAYQEWQEA